MTSTEQRIECTPRTSAKFSSNKTFWLSLFIAAIGFAGGSLGTAFSLGIDRERFINRLANMESLKMDHEHRIRQIEKSMNQTQNDVAWIRKHLEKHFQ